MSEDKTNQQKVKKHFEENLLFSKLFWYRKNDLSLHMGFWDDDTKSLSEALLNENKMVAKSLDISRNDKILDVGCGVGGTAIWVAREYNAKVVGVDLVEQNIKIAKKYTKKKGVKQLVNFYVGNFFNQSFNKNEFDKLYCIETFCYIENKKEFLKRAYDILKPGGKMMIADYFKGENTSNENLQILEKWSNEWAMPKLFDKKTLTSVLTEAGFSSVKIEDRTKQVLPSSARLKRISLAVYPVLKLMYYLKLISGHPSKDVLSSELKLFSDRSITYLTISMEK